IGNEGAGFFFHAVTPGKVPIVRSNNISDNRGRVLLDRTSGSGCGLINESGQKVDAIRNFWGRAAGPGPNPGDLAGPSSGCDRGTGSVTLVTPFATTAFVLVR